MDMLATIVIMVNKFINFFIKFFSMQATFDPIKKYLYFKCFHSLAQGLDFLANGNGNNYLFFRKPKM